MTVISVDLAYKRYSDIGVAALTQVDDGVSVEVIRLANLGLSGQPAASDLARCFLTLAQDRGAQVMLIDGPQAWKSPSNRLEHSRRCERALNTPGKTGLPGNTKPANYCGFITFSIELFDELASHGWPRLAAINPPDPACRFTIESFPTSAWRKLGLIPLPGKSRGDSGISAAKTGGASGPLFLAGSARSDTRRVAGARGRTRRTGSRTR